MKIFILFLFTLFLFSCSEDNTVQSTAGKSEVTISINNLNDPADSMYYEAWMQTDAGDNISLGLLRKENESYILTSQPTEETIFHSITTFISIEKDTSIGIRFSASGDTIKGPSNNIVVSCVNDANQGVFSVGNGFITTPGNANAITSEFLFEDDAQASFIIHTATEGNGFEVFNPGIIAPFYENSWIYEAFLEKDGNILSLGQFFDPAKTDNSFIYSGSVRSEYTSFPGEDFINNPDETNLNFKNIHLGQSTII